MLELLAEDFRTHDRDLLAPGFWAVALHRFGNWRMGIRKPFRAPVTVAYNTLFKTLELGFGIHLSYTVKLGRRVRLWYHGGMRLGARAIGDDVHIRHNTTMGVIQTGHNTKKPIIEDRVDIGTGACILGDVTIGHDSVIGANSVVVPVSRRIRRFSGCRRARSTCRATWPRLRRRPGLAMQGEERQLPESMPGDRRRVSDSITEWLSTLARQRVLFVHHSVGRNVQDGLSALASEAKHSAALRIVSIDEAARLGGPGWIDASGGRNHDPNQNCFLRRGPSPAPNGAALLGVHEAVLRRFQPKDRRFRALRLVPRRDGSPAHSASTVTLAHVTVPLTSRPETVKDRLYRAIGREVWEDSANVRRHEFNRLLAESSRKRS